MRICQDIFNAAIARSTANDASMFVSATAELLREIDRAQQELFTELAAKNHTGYLAVVVVPSTAAVARRVVDLSTQTLPVERILLVQLPSGTEVAGVDIQDQGAEFPPRYYQLGQTLVEIASDWSPVNGAVQLTIAYVYRPAALTLTALDLSQAVSTPDRFCSYLEADLAWYIATKDFGRGVGDAAEQERLLKKRDEVLARFLASLTEFGGLQAQRFILPVPGSKA